MTDVYDTFFADTPFTRDVDAWRKAIAEKRGVIPSEGQTEVHDLVGYRPMTTGGRAYVVAKDDGAFERVVREEGERVRYPLDADSDLAKEVLARISA